MTQSSILIDQYDSNMNTAHAMIERNDAQEKLLSFIADGDYAPGDKLPSERELMGSMSLTRTSLRKGLDALERDGVIWRHVGKGTFISSNEPTNVIPGLEKLSQQITPVQMMRARLALEPAIAREAAANASADAVNLIRQARDRTTAATTWENYEANDDAFHEAVAHATGNVLLQSLYNHLNQVHRAVAWGQVIRKTDSPPKEHPSFAQHDEILAAIEARDPIAAHAAMRAHLDSVSARLFGDVIP